MALSIAAKPVDIKVPQRQHEFKVGKPARNIWADKAAQLKRAEELKRRQLAEIRRKEAEAKRIKQAEVKRAERIKQAEQRRTINVEASAYIALCREGCTGKTSTNIDVRNTQFYKGKRVIAVDPRIIPLGTTGTLALSSGQSFAVIAADTGGAIVGNKIDVLVSSEGEAKQLGRQSAVLTID